MGIWGGLTVADAVVNPFSHHLISLVFFRFAALFLASFFCLAAPYIYLPGPNEATVYCAPSIQQCM